MAVAERVERELREWRVLGMSRRGSVEAVWPGRSVGLGSFVLFVLMLSGLFGAQQLYPLVAVGSADAVKIFDTHQWWRVMTALSLHADVVHLASNLVAGWDSWFW